MKKLATVVALLMLTTALPVATAMHLSVGGSDTIGTGDSAISSLETSETPSVNGDAYDIGITPQDQCYENNAAGAASAEEIQAAVTAEDFCGELLYDQSVADELGSDRTSTPDQHFPGTTTENPIRTFDVQRTHYVGYLGLILCEPFCREDVPDAVSEPAWEGVHQVGSTAGVTDNGETADQKEGDDRGQLINHRFDVAGAATFIQRNTGAWQMNGWQMPESLATFVGFIETDQGDIVTNRTIEDLAGTADLPPGHTPKVCGYVPQIDFGSTGTQSFCDTQLVYEGPENPNEPGGTDTKADGYDNPCESPQYVCGPTAGAYWESNSIGLCAYGGCSQTDIVTWHWFIAPNPPECGNVNPGVDFDADGHQLPYLAHDMDVYSTITELAVGPQASADGATDYYSAATDDVFDVPGLPDEVQDALDEVSGIQENSPVTKDDSVEPNAVQSEQDASGILEDSRSAANGIVVDRDAPDACQSLIASETDQTRDPWVNIADGKVLAQQDVHIDHSFDLGDIDLFLRTDTYNGQDENQDASNRPGPNAYSTRGKLGVFADRDDDGHYDVVIGPADEPTGFGLGVYQKDQIQSTGAYPMLWDMEIKEGTQDDPQIDTEAGCEGPGEQPFSKTMKQAGYGPNTGLLQAIYLKEPTVFTSGGTQNNPVVPYPLGNNIYVLASEGARDLWTPALDDGVNAFDVEADNFVQNLKSHAIDNLGADAETLNVVQPGQEIGLEGDYASQCGESTGGFDSVLDFLHFCPNESADTPVTCEGDTIATMYSFEVADTGAISGTLGGGEIPHLFINGAPHDFTAGQNTWTDLDPFDNDPTRNDDDQDRPPTGE